MIVRVVTGGAAGAIIGFFLSVIMIVATIALSFLTESTVGVPYVIESSFKEVEGLPELSFTPNAPGIIGVIVACGAIAALCSLTTGRPRAKKRQTA